MRPYHEYTPDQSFLLPPSFDGLIAVDDPMRFLREVLPGLDLSAFHAAYRAERRPPYNPEMMLGLLLYGHMRHIRSSRRMAEACRRDVAFIYLWRGRKASKCGGGAQPSGRGCGGQPQKMPVVSRSTA